MEIEGFDWQEVRRGMHSVWVSWLSKAYIYQTSLFILPFVSFGWVGWGEVVNRVRWKGLSWIISSRAQVGKV